MTTASVKRFLLRQWTSLLKRLRVHRPNNADWAFLERMPAGHRARLAALTLQSTSQNCQDLLVLSFTNFKRGGFFVEFGAADGKSLSNTWLLEKRFAWKGIIAEPTQSYEKRLRMNRSCSVDTRCVWSTSGELVQFREARNRVLSTIDRFSSLDMHAEARQEGVTYPVATVSLEDLLLEHHAPASPDFLSIDTEGSEYEILRAFDFNRWRFKLICCEHAYTAAREQLHDLFTSNGYRRIHQDISLYDDWYILAELVP